MPVRKAGLGLGNYSDAPVLNPLIRALQVDVAAVRLWASVSLAEAGSTSPPADLPGQLLLGLKIDSEPVVRSNCIWALGRLHDMLVKLARRKVKLRGRTSEGSETAVRDEARTSPAVRQSGPGGPLADPLDEGLLL